MAGAQYHHIDECTLPHFIRPFLFAFYKEGPPEIKAFVKENLCVSVWEDDDIETFLKWMRVRPGDDAPNHIKLYWWVLKFWGRS